MITRLIRAAIAVLNGDMCQAVIAVYPLEEMLAEKMRALLRRRYARDVYDLWFLFKHHAHEMDLKAASPCAR